MYAYVKFKLRGSFFKLFMHNMHMVVFINFINAYTHKNLILNAALTFLALMHH